MEHHKWESTFFPVSIDFAKEYTDILNRGIIYIHKRDKYMHPIFILNMKLLTESKLAPDTVINMTCYLIQFLIMRGMVPGKCENWVTIFDMKGVGVTNVPKKLMKSITKPLQTYFKGRLFRLYCINAKWIINMCWKIAKKVVDPLTI